MATKYTQLDALSVEVDGEIYSLRAPPSSDSKVVLMEVEHLEADFDIQYLLQKLELTAGCISIVRYGVTGTDEGVEKDVDQTLARVAMVLQQAMNDVVSVARTDLLSKVVDGVIFLFLGEESLGWDRVEESRKDQALLMKMSGVRKDSLEHIRSSFRETLASIRVIMARARNEEATGKNIRFADDALSNLGQDITVYSHFWERLNSLIEKRGNCNTMEGLKRLSEQDKKKIYMNSNTFRKQIVTYYARWVALKDMCTSLLARLQSVQENVLSSLAARPRSVEEARKELPKMHEDMEEMVRKQCEERMKMMEDNEDDF